MPPSRKPVVVAAGATFAVVAAAHLVAQLVGTDGTAGSNHVADVTQWFLMPLLALTLWLAADGVRATRLVRPTLAALALSWLGDTAPDAVGDDLSFVTMLGFFLLAHVCYLVAFWPLRGDGVLGRRPALAIPYAAAFVALVVVCAPGTGALLVPTIVYGAALTAVALLSTFDRLAAIGGALFLLSDSLIALDAFVDGYALPAHGFWVMLTYVAAQALIAAGVLRTVRARRALRAPSPAS